MDRGIDALKSSYDVIVVGAGAPARRRRCFSHARGARRAGRRAGRPWRGHAVDAGADAAGVLQLSRWGLLDAIKQHADRDDHVSLRRRAIEIRIKPREGVDASRRDVCWTRCLPTPRYRRAPGAALCLTEGSGVL